MIKKKKKIVIIINILIFITLNLIIWNYYNTKSSIQNNIVNNENNNLEEEIYNLPDTPMFEKLESLIKEDKRINKILKNYQDYPEELLDMLSRDIDVLDFALEYPERNGNVYSSTIGTVKKGTYPLLIQWDKRWGYANYGDNNIAMNGCGITSLAMVIAGLTGDNKITPYIVAKYAEENGYYVYGVGTSWDLMTEGSKYFGIIGRELTLSKEAIYNSLENGYPIICSMGPGDFTTLGHFIVLTEIKDGKIKVNDPNSIKRSSILWDYDTLSYQIKNLWQFSLL